MIKPIYSLLARNTTRVLLLSMLIFSSVPAGFGQTVTLDATSTGQGSTTGGFSGPFTASWAHACTGTDRVLVVSIAQNKGFTGTNEITGITYNGAALTQQLQTTNGSFEAELWYLIAPSTGANAVVISSAANTMYYVGTSISFTNAHQTAGSLIGNTNGGTGSSTTSTGAAASVTSTTVADMIINNYSCSVTSPSIPITGTLDARNIAQAGLGQFWGGCQTKQGTGGAIASQYHWGSFGFGDT
jgi:hypothetical protein